MLSAVPAAGAAAQCHVPREDTARLEHPRWSVGGAVAYDWRGENSGGGDDYPTDTFAFDLGVRRVAIRGVGFEIAAGVALASEDAGHSWAFGSAKGEEAEIRDPSPAAASGSRPDGSCAAP